ncbi:MAG TPA: amidohydrolase [Thermodesulfobacteriota bacterium]|nr:amidohydrolase [Thermodesulfobacteriota bacterium]
MQIKKAIFLTLFLSLALVPALTQASSVILHYPDMILYNGKVVTADKKFSIGQAVAIRDGKFLGVGRSKDILALAGRGTVKMDLKGKTVIPGLIDTHNHMEEAGEALHKVPLGKAKTVAEALTLIKEWAAKTKPGEWIRGGGWHPLAQLQEKRYLTRREIDSVAPDNPVFLPTVGHFVMVNSYAMKLAGITKDTPNPPGGEIQKDPTTGEPNGVLAETAIPLVSKVVPPWPFDLRVKMYKDAMRTFNSAGLTGVVIGLTDPESFKIYQHIWGNREATMRVSLMYCPTGEPIPAEPLDEWERMIRGIGCYSDFGDDWLSFSGIKLIMDGGMTLRTAYMREPYPHDRTYYGSPLIPPERLNKLVAACNRYNWRVGIHCVGDAAIDKVLDAYENANKEKSILDRRFILIHASLMQPDQMERAKKLGVRVDLQNDFMWDKAATVERFLGKESASRACPTRWMIDRMGIENIGAGTDYPVNTYNPFINIYVMVTRKDKNGVVYGANQKINREEALRLYTNGAAAYSFKEDAKGSIEPAKLADLVVISDDILTCPEESIKDIKALMTIVGGKIVYRDPGF